MNFGPIWEQLREKYRKKEPEITHICECSHVKYHHDTGRDKCAYCECKKYDEI